jgi:phospholipase/lecithinase/hemolysin
MHGDIAQRVFRESLIALFVAASLFGWAEAAPFTKLIVFGDSLSDVGNVSDATTDLVIIAPIPGPYYYNGRFSNGPAYSELMARGLGLPGFTFSREGGTNYAHGGAKTSGTAFPESVVVRDVDDQVSDFLNGPAADPNALFVFFAGANDVLDLQRSMTTAANRLTTDIARVIADGARHVMVFNLPPLGHAPRFFGNPANIVLHNERSTQYNAAVSTGVAGLRSANPLVELIEFDAASLYDEALANPLSFGLTNVTHAAAPGLEPGDSSYNTSLIAPNVHEYAFWDDLHPTSTVHAALAEKALALLAEGDYNWDGQVDSADYVALRKGLFIGYGASHYHDWRENFGNSGGNGQGRTVPEPQAYMLAVAAFSAICGLRRPIRYNGAWHPDD